MTKIDIEMIPARADNYIYLIRDPVSGVCGVVDPGEVQPVMAKLNELGWRPDWIINTHHHDDHIAGNGTLIEHFGAKLAAPKADRHRIEGIDLFLAEGQSFEFGTQQATVFETPGHTSGHVSLWFKDTAALFCGDTLFALGCGRLFEGSPSQMWHSLSKFSSLPDDTLIYCGHEYTQSNARFALSIDPNNAELCKRAQEIDRAREDGQSTIPSTMGVERTTNPFLRPHDEKIRKSLDMIGDTDAAVFARVREMKDSF